jgi:hypothetical protein
MNQKVKDTLLLSCVGMGSDEAIASQVQQLSRPDWNEVTQGSARHRIIPLLYLRIRTLSLRANIPPDIDQKLREIYLHTSWKNMQRYYELSKVLRALQDNHIPVIVLKGAALAGSIYQNIALRPMCDVDLLVRCEDIHRIDEVLPELGFRAVTVPISKRCMQWIRHMKYTNGTIMIEFHPKIPGVLSLDPWANASPARIGSADTLMLGAEDLLLHLCLHLDHHLCTGSSTLIWWCDIIKLLKHYQKELNWDYVMRVAKENRIEAAIRRILHTIDEVFDICIPADVLSQPKDDDIISIDAILDPNEALNREPDPLLPAISTIPSTHDKLYYILRRFFPCKEYMERRYSVSRSDYVYFYYFLSMGEAAIKALKILHQLPSYLWSQHISRPD